MHGFCHEVVVCCASEYFLFGTDSAGRLGIGPIGFKNCKIYKAGGLPYAFVQIMSYTPGENTDGYEDAVGIVKDEGTMSERTLWTDKCSSCEFRANGVVAKPENETE